MSEKTYADVKKNLRRRIINSRDQMSRVEIEQKSTKIAEKLYALPEYKNASSILFFLSFGSEVDTRPMVEETIERGKIALAPKTVSKTRKLLLSQILDWDKDLAPGVYNIPEPRSEALRLVDPETVELVIVPGVAFDRRGNRLGYGGGYYDRFFMQLRKNTPLIALAFELQIVSSVPVDYWDRLVDLIITEKDVIKPDTCNHI